MSLRAKVLKLYRQILRVSRTWEAQDSKETTSERKYIQDEARMLFKQNKNVSKSCILHPAVR